ncbi:L-aspartate oxidase [Fulvivirga sp. M361]|uniref:L-aspartate oxidase n=1 Tax=Fulvivirga sp. M361 TaxID=2594266 RepID=UPI00117A11BF|nr:L-aspartate oxidase [Fulvivirga sp. M361]TRX59419.1 L-aspartate oxidase [Fulvivirga sp. M361]
MPTTDFLVIGSGIAGLSFALKVAGACPNCSVTVVTKANEGETNTKYAQGGIAVALDQYDSAEKHIQDTLKAGDGLCDEEVVNFVVREGPHQLEELMRLGTRFDRSDTGELDLAKEGGHSMNRVVHHKDITGLEIERALLKRVATMKNIRLLSHHFAIDLITEHHLEQEYTDERTCYGAYILNSHTNQVSTCTARTTLLALGGIGQVYGHTTNPVIATGDGIAMAYRARAEIMDMEFIQFHPTALYQPGVSPAFLISEAVRGFGAMLKTKNEDRFMFRYDDRGELASRDIVALAIDKELKNSGDECVYLDCRHLEMDAFQSHFPTIFQKCKLLGLDPAKDMIPVLPAAHYLCGGIKVDHFGRTSVKQLYACGENARTGLHGANRLASNSLLEALVFSERCFLKAMEDSSSPMDFRDVPEWDARGTITPKEHILIAHNRRELQAIMRDYVGIVRSDERLKRASSRLGLLYKETEHLYKSSTLSPQLCELRNLITTGYLIVSQSLKRRVNRGGYYNVDV